MLVVMLYISLKQKKVNKIENNKIEKNDEISDEELDNLVGDL